MIGLQRVSETDDDETDNANSDASGQENVLEEVKEEIAEEKAEIDKEDVAIEKEVQAETGEDVEDENKPS